MNIASNNLGDDGGKSFARAIRDSTSLVSIDLRLNNIGFEGRQALEEAIEAISRSQLIVEYAMQ